MVRCPGRVGPTWPARERVPARGYQVFAGTSEWDRMGATPVRWISARRAGMASPQAYVFHRSSRRARVRVGSLVLAEMGPMTDGRPFPLAIYRPLAESKVFVTFNERGYAFVVQDVRGKFRSRRPGPNGALRL